MPRTIPRTIANVPGGSPPGAPDGIGSPIVTTVIPGWILIVVMARWVRPPQPGSEDFVAFLFAAGAFWLALVVLLSTLANAIPGLASGIDWLSSRPLWQSRRLSIALLLFGILIGYRFW